MFILDTDRLRIGDIILTADQTLLSKGIRAATGGSFSHAMLYVADHSYIIPTALGCTRVIHSADCLAHSVTRPCCA